MSEEYHFYSSCNFYILKEGNSRKKCLNIYSEAKSYGAFASLSEVLSIASDFTENNNLLSYNKNMFKDVKISFKKINDLPYCELFIKLKDKKYKKNLKDIKDNFINIKDRFIKVHNFRKNNESFIVYLKFNSELKEIK